jgi:O-antigen/teichoic acid export membrane protein
LGHFRGDTNDDPFCQRVLAPAGHYSIVTADTKAEVENLHGRILSGSAVLLTGYGLIAGLQFLYNASVAWFLGPAAFGHATAVYTLLILISAITLSFQIVSAKVVARQLSLEGKCAVYRRLHHRAWVTGILVGLLFFLFRNTIAIYLNLPDPVLVSLLALSVVFYIPLGARRGFILGACSFRRFSLNLILEGSTRLGGSLLMMVAGYGVVAVIAANAAAVILAYLLAHPKPWADIPADLHVPVGFHEGLQAIVFFVGQVIISNCDIIVVKHLFAAKEAGVYAAVALVGRVVFYLCWAVVNTMFPIVAETKSRGQKHHGVLLTSVLLVLTIGFVMTLATRIAPHVIWTTLFGAEFGGASGHSLSYLLSLYAAATTIYALGVVFIAYEMSYKIANTGWLQLAFAGLLIAGIYGYHSSLVEVIWVQVALKATLLALVAVPFVRKRWRTSEITQASADSGALRKIRAVTEDEVIAAFLKNDFQNKVFTEYRQLLNQEVMTPDLEDALENARRRALLFIRHGSLWRELPEDTQWCEIELRPADLQRIRVFPRAQWRKLARGSFAITEIAHRITQGGGRRPPTDAFFTKIEDLRKQVGQGTPSGAVLLIGVDEKSPLTILDGNHRLVAAMLTSPEALKTLRFFCGLSPRMTTCCWYETNFSTLFRYGTHRLGHAVRDPEAKLAQLLQGSTPSL